MIIYPVWKTQHMLENQQNQKASEAAAASSSEAEKTATGTEQPDTETAPAMNADISKEEMLTLEGLESAFSGDTAERAFLDNTDEDGTPLNEKAGYSKESGSDLDVPGAELDDADEEIGEEDEENNSYSQADTE